MLGLTLHSTTHTDKIQLTIPDELKGIELQIIIIPANSNTQTFEFFSEAELQQLSTINLSAALQDEEDYTKW